MDKVEDSGLTKSEILTQMYKDIDYVTKVNFSSNPVVNHDWSISTPTVSFYESSYDPNVVTSMEMFLDWVDRTNTETIKKFNELPKVIVSNSFVRTTPPSGKLVLVVDNKFEDETDDEYWGSVWDNV